jgi:dATP pyrophosphohydrolase
MRQAHEVLVFVHRPGVEGEEFLVLHRVDGGYWHGLAGGLEDDETPHAAAQREILEESGLAAGEALGATGHTFRYSLAEEPERLETLPAGTTHIDVTCFEVEVPAGWEPELDDEHDDHRWCSLAEAAALYRWDDARAALLHAGSLLGVPA